MAGTTSLTVGDKTSRERVRGYFAPFVARLRHSLGDELHGLLIHGSAIRDLSNADDYDLIFVLRSNSVAGVRRIRHELAAFEWDRPLEVQIVCRNQLPLHADDFTLKAGGTFLVYRLRDALTLTGRNPFTDLVDPSQPVVRRSLLAEVQRNLWFARHAAGQGAAQLTDHEIYHVAKKMWWSIKDLMMWVGEDASDLVTNFRQACIRFPGMLSDDSRNWLESVADRCGRERDLFSQLSTDDRNKFLDRVLGVHEAVYGQLIRLAERDLAIRYHGKERA